MFTQTTFSTWDLSPKILSGLAEAGFEFATQVQRDTIPIALSGRDVIGQARTGSGKTAAFGLPVLNACTPNSELQALILTPTRELASQIDENVRNYCKSSNLRSTVVFGGIPQRRQVEALRRGVDILIATPGRLLDLCNQGHIRLKDLEILVLDEADTMLDMGFIHDIKKIIKQTPKERQTLFFSATMPPNIRELSSTILKEPIRVQIAAESSAAETVDQKVYYVRQNDKKDLLVYILGTDEIINALRSYNNLIPAGTLSDSNAEFSVKVPSLYENYSDLEKLPIKSINNFILTLGDVALVKRSFNKTEEYVTVNGKSALNINVSRKSGTNVLDTYDAVKRVLLENENSFHPLIKAVLVDDDSIGVRQRISASENTVITAVMLVMIIIVGVLGLRSGILIGLSIPLTYLFSILILDFVGMTYNLMTIFGLILAVGLLVDGPIVISEYARSEQEKGVRRRDSYVNASYNMFWPIIASALTTIVAFIPLIFWPDTIGQWLKVIPVTVIVVLTTSLIVTLIFVPSLGAMIEKKTADMQPNVNQSNFLYLKYESILSNAIENPIKVILLTTLSFILIILLYKNFNTGVQFFPDDKADSARINITARGNLSVDEKSKYINDALEVISNKPYIDQYVSN